MAPRVWVGNYFVGVAGWMDGWMGGWGGVPVWVVVGGATVVSTHRMTEDMYTRDDVMAIVDLLRTQARVRRRRAGARRRRGARGVLVQASTSYSLERIANMAALVVEQLLNQAADKSVGLYLDMEHAEDESACANAYLYLHLCAAALRSPSMRWAQAGRAALLADVGKVLAELNEAELKKRASTAVRLEAIREEATRTASENTRLREEVTGLRDRVCARTGVPRMCVCV